MVFGSLEYVVNEPAHYRQRNDPSGSKRVAAKSLGEFYYKLALAWHGTYLKCPWALWAQKVSKFCSAGLFCIAVFCRRCRFARYTSISPHGRCKILQGRFFLAVPCVFLRLCLAGVLSGLGGLGLSASLNAVCTPIRSPMSLDVLKANRVSWFLAVWTPSEPST